MAKPLKIALIILGAVLALFIGLAIALPLMFDPNDYRGKIQDAAKESTGREFTVGDIKLRVFPWIAVSLRDAKLGNAEGFGPEPFAQIGEADVGVKLMPLLMSRNIEVSTVTLKGLRLNLAKDKDGKNNWSDLSKPKEDKPEEPEQPGEVKLDKLRIGGIKIEDAQLTYADAQSGKRYAVQKLDLDTGALEPGKPVDLDLDLAVSSAAPALESAITLSTTLDANTETQLFKFSDLKLGTKTKMADGTNADVDLSSDAGSLDLKAQQLAIGALKLKLGAALKDMKVDATLASAVTANLETQVFKLEGIKLEGKASGSSIPGGEQPFALAGGLDFDAKQGTMQFRDAVLQAAGLTINTQIKGEELLGESPKLSGPIKLQKFSPRELLAKLGKPVPETADPNVLKELAFSADFSGGKSSATLNNMNLKLDQSTATGTLNVRDFATQAIDFAFKVDQLDADRYLAPKKNAPAAQEKTAAQKSDINATPLPNDTLNALNAQGTLDVGQFKLSNVKMSDARVKLSGGRGQVKTQDISAKLYGGSIGFSNQFTPGAKPRYAIKTQLNGLNAQPFLVDFLGKDMASGLANFTLNISGAGATIGDLRKSLNGDTGFKVENGAVKGFNLASILRKGQALLRKDFNYQEPAEAKKTDFATLSASGKIVNGILKTDNLSAASPLLRLAGEGQIDLINETIDYVAKPTVVETSTGQDGKALEDLRGITVPIKLSGSLFAPSYKLDIEGALKQKAMSKINEKIDTKKDELKEKLNNKLNDRLNKLFGNKQPAPAAETTPQQ